MWMSMREAAGLLAELGINRESARTALAAGLAGEVRRAGGAHLVEERSVRAVMERATQPPVSGAALAEARQAGIFTARLGPRRETPDEEWRSWRGIAVVGAEITGIIRRPAEPQGRRCRFELREAGPWYDELRGRQLLTSGGPPWVTLGAGRIAG
jgi:hypothetical protein